jgi:hypothetical protein
MLTPPPPQKKRRENENNLPYRGIEDGEYEPSL